MTSDNYLIVLFYTFFPVLIIKSIHAINPKAPESLQEIVKNLNQRIYGVFVENEKTRIKTSLLEIYKMYLQIENITYDEITEENQENESPEERLERYNEWERILQMKMTNGFSIKKVQFQASIYRKPGYCTIKTTTFDPKFLSIIKSFDKKNRTYNLIDKSWQIPHHNQDHWLPLSGQMCRQRAPEPEAPVDPHCCDTADSLVFYISEGVIPTSHLCAVKALWL